MIMIVKGMILTHYWGIGCVDVFRMNIRLVTAAFSPD